MDGLVFLRIFFFFLIAGDCSPKAFTQDEGFHSSHLLVQMGGGFILEGG